MKYVLKRFIQILIFAFRQRFGLTALTKLCNFFQIFLLFYQHPWQDCQYQNVSFYFLDCLTYALYLSFSHKVWQCPLVFHDRTCIPLQTDIFHNLLLKHLIGCLCSKETSSQLLFAHFLFTCLSLQSLSNLQYPH